MSFKLIPSKWKEMGRNEQDIGKIDGQTENENNTCTHFNQQHVEKIDGN